MECCCGCWVHGGLAKGQRAGAAHPGAVSTPTHAGACLETHARGPGWRAGWDTPQETRRRRKRINFFVPSTCDVARLGGKVCSPRGAQPNHDAMGRRLWRVRPDVRARPPRRHALCVGSVHGKRHTSALCADTRCAPLPTPCQQLHAAHVPRAAGATLQVCVCVCMRVCVCPGVPCGGHAAACVTRASLWSGSRASFCLCSSAPGALASSQGGSDSPLCSPLNSQFVLKGCDWCCYRCAQGKGGADAWV